MQRRSLALVVLALLVTPAGIPVTAALGDALPTGPTADLTISPEFPRSHEVTTFRSAAISKVPIIAYDWTFEQVNGSTTTMSGEVVERAFVIANRSNQIQVTHTVTDALGRSASISRTMLLENSPPNAAFLMNPSPAFRNTAVTFHDISTDIDDQAIGWSTWDFGDGAPLESGQNNVTHSYAALGLYAVTLTVSDEEGSVSSSTQMLRILNHPPMVGDISIMPADIIVGEPATFTMSAMDPDGSGAPLTYSWDFSDGLQLNGQQVTRTFSTPGNYTVTGRAKDADGGVSAPHVKGFRVDSVRPQAAFTWTPTVPVAGQVVQFRDLSTSASGPIKAWRWNFDGSASSTSTQKDPTFVYSRNGTFLVQLEVTDAQDRTASVQRSIFVNLAPQARFQLPGSTRVGQPVSIMDTSVDADGMIVNWTWSFGEGSVSYARHPTHAWSAPGVYEVRLTVRDEHGATGSAMEQILVENARPVALWSVSEGTGVPTRGVPIQFLDASYDLDGSIVSHQWSFGDGQTSTAQNPTHAFAQSGVHRVGLVVDDGTHVSETTDRSHMDLRIGPDHNVLVHIGAHLPDGRTLDLNDPRYTLTARLDGTLLDFAPGAPHSTRTPNGHRVDLWIDRALWLHGSTLLLRLDGAPLLIPSETVVQLADGRIDISLDMIPRMGIAAAISIDSATNTGPLAPIIGHASTFEGAPVYADATEGAHGTGRVTWHDGFGMASGLVRIEARYIGLGASAPLRDGDLPDRTLAPEIAGWCVVDTTLTDATGAFTWAFDAATPCPTHANAAGTHGPGRWEVRAVISIDTEWGTKSPARAFYIDPTGGLMLGAGAGVI